MWNVSDYTGGKTSMIFACGRGANSTLILEQVRMAFSSLRHSLRMRWGQSHRTWQGKKGYGRNILVSLLQFPGCEASCLTFFIFSSFDVLILQTVRHILWSVTFWWWNLIHLATFLWHTLRFISKWLSFKNEWI